MGKHRKRMLMKKYAKKYASKREALGYTVKQVTNGVVTIDMTTSEEIKEEEQVQVVVNEPVVEEKGETPPWEVEPEPELELIQVEEPETKEEAPPPPKKKSTTTKTTTTKKKATARKTPTRKRTTKKKVEG